MQLSLYIQNRPSITDVSICLCFMLLSLCSLSVLLMYITIHNCQNSIIYVYHLIGYMYVHDIIECLKLCFHVCVSCPHA